ncbi:MAG: biotin/lipoyl-binding protein [Acidobacteria bacterium]|nr:biotin/lipoyl-binding protein [Acidobacteriota bacterium]
MTRKVLLNGSEVAVDAGAWKDFIEVEPGVYSVIREGRVLEVRLDGKWAWAGGHRFEIEVIDPREMTESKNGSARQGRLEITAPMPGKVVRVLAEEGSEVTAGQGILVVEAMKMQNEMQSPKAGRLVSVRVEAGSAVAAGEVLAVVE